MKGFIEMIQSLRNTVLKVICIFICLQFCVIHARRLNSLAKKGHHRRQGINIGEYSDEPDPIRRQGGRPGQDGDVYEFHRFQHYGFKTPAPTTFSLESMLAFLAPLATIPIIASAALSSMAAILPSLTTEGMVKGRSRREAVLDLLDSSWNASSTLLYEHDTRKSPIKRDAGDLDVIHRYLQQVNPSGNYNDEVMASYLRCSGMLGSGNHCLERLVCQFSSDGMAAMEKEVSSVIIYTILSNKFIKDEFKERLRKAAFFGRDSNGRCGLFICSRNDFTSH